MGIAVLFIFGAFGLWQEKRNKHNYLRNAFGRYLNPIVVDELAGEQTELKPNKGAASFFSAVNIALLMSVILTIAVSGTALYVILKGQYSEGAAKWAYGAIGTVLGYWLRPPT
jgi:hypothetical protein